ncbi:MAG: DUF6585 family protein [Putridiphycobacter sp.]
MEFPQIIVISKNSKKQALKYFLPIVSAYAIATCGFSGMFDHGVLISLISIAICILLIVLIYRKDQQSKRTIVLTAEGIKETSNHATTFISWGENHQVYYHGTAFMFSGVIPIGSLVSIQIVTSTKRIKIDTPNQEFNTSILTLSHQHIFPQIKQRIDANNKVNFGEVALDKTHIYLGQEKLNRQDIEAVKVENGKLILKLANKWFSSAISVEDIANFSSLIQLVK